MNVMHTVTMPNASGAATSSAIPCLTSQDRSAVASVSAPNAPTTRVASVVPICTADRNLLGSDASRAAFAPRLPRLRQRPDLPLAQRDQRHLRRGEKPADAHDDNDDDDVPDDLAHAVIADFPGLLCQPRYRGQSRRDSVCVP